MPDASLSSSLFACAAAARERPAVPLLQAVHLVRRDAARGTTLLSGIEFQLSGGDRVAITGPSGAGKSVLLRALAMLDPLDGGCLLWRGEPVRDAAIPAYRRRVAYIAQRPALLEGSVEDNLRYPFSLGIYRDLSFDRSVVSGLARAAGRSDDFLRQRADDLSGGEAQIVAVIRVLQLDPEILLLDEPTASLDSVSARRIEALVAAWFDRDAATYGSAGSSPRAFAWVSHDPEPDDRGRTGEPAGHDDRPDPGWAAAHAGSTLSHRHHVPDRGVFRAGDGRRGAADLSTAVFAATSFLRGEAHRARQR
jgi:putative ABC transport system ATP-binding protein